MVRTIVPRDVLVVGGGPTAATAARLLARWGRRVTIVARPPGDEPELPESLTPSCGKFFDLMAIRASDRRGRLRPQHAATRCGGARRSRGRSRSPTAGTAGRRPPAG